MSPGHKGNPRRCIATGASLAKSELVRFAISPDNVLLPDVLARLPGRGIWVTASAAAVESAVAKRSFTRAARRPIELPPDLPQIVEAQLAKRVINMLALARKSGAAIAGFTKVRAAIAAERVAVLLQASDGSPAQLRRVAPQSCNIASVQTLSAEELGIAFRRDHVIHAAVASGRIATHLLEEARRLAGFRISAPIANCDLGNSRNDLIRT